MPPPFLLFSQQAPEFQSTERGSFRSTPGGEGFYSYPDKIKQALQSGQEASGSQRAKSGAGLGSHRGPLHPGRTWSNFSACRRLSASVSFGAGCRAWLQARSARDAPRESDLYSATARQHGSRFILPNPSGVFAAANSGTGGAWRLAPLCPFWPEPSTCSLTSLPIPSHSILINRLIPT
jgi:hypothetical protein